MRRNYSNRNSFCGKQLSVLYSCPIVCRVPKFLITRAERKYFDTAGKQNPHSLGPWGPRQHDSDILYGSWKSLATCAIHSSS